MGRTCSVWKLKFLDTWFFVDLLQLKQSSYYSRLSKSHLEQQQQKSFDRTKNGLFVPTLKVENNTWAFSFALRLFSLSWPHSSFCFYIDSSHAVLFSNDPAF